MKEGGWGEEREREGEGWREGGSDGERRKEVREGRSEGGVKRRDRGVIHVDIKVEFESLPTYQVKLGWLPLPCVAVV